MTLGLLASERGASTGDEAIAWPCAMLSTMRFCERTGAGLLLASLTSCGCGRAADTQERVERFEAMLSEELGTEVKLVCPAMVDRSPQYCTAVVPSEDDLVFPVRVTSQGDELDYATKRWVSGTRMVELGKHALQEKLDITVDSLTCPKISHMPDGTTVRCEASAEGIAIPIDVSMVVKVRKLDFEPVGGVVFGDDAARAAHETLHEQGAHAEVSCPRRVVVSTPGKRFECEALMPDQTVRTVHYLITGADGTFAVGTEPPQLGGPSDTETSEKEPADSALERDQQGEAPR